MHNDYPVWLYTVWLYTVCGSDFSVTYGGEKDINIDIHKARPPYLKPTT